MHKIVRDVVICGVTVSLLSVFGCMLSPKDLVGSYTLDKKGWSGKLTLNPDGSLSESVVRDEGETIQIEGKWKFDGSSLYRAPCVRLGPLGEGEKIDACHQAVLWTIGGPMIAIDKDFGIAYDRDR